MTDTIRFLHLSEILTIFDLAISIATSQPTLAELAIRFNYSSVTLFQVFFFTCGFTLVCLGVIWLIHTPHFYQFIP